MAQIGQLSFSFQHRKSTLTAQSCVSVSRCYTHTHTQIHTNTRTQSLLSEPPVVVRQKGTEEVKGWVAAKGRREVRGGGKIVVCLTSLQFPGTEARQGRENAKRASETHTLTSAQPESLCYHNEKDSVCLCVCV